MKKGVVLLLVSLLVLSSYASCSKPESTHAGSSQDQTQPDQQTTEPSKSEENEIGESVNDIDFTNLSFIDRLKYTNSLISDDLPEITYDGKSFGIMGINFPDEINGEVLNDSLFAQKTTIEERFNVKLEYVTHNSNTWDGYIAEVNSWFNAGEDFAGLIENNNAATSGFAVKGYFDDLSKYPVIDTSKPWYFKDEMDLYGYKGHYYVATGTMNARTVMNAIHVTFFNKSIQQEYGMDDFYQVVRDGGWTLDYVKKIVSDFYFDLDGDGTKNESDLYGLSYATLGSWMVELPALGIPQISKDPDGIPTLSAVSDAEHVETVMDSLKELTEMEGSRCVDEWAVTAFDTGKALFAVRELQYMNVFRDGNLELDFGILPPFKADEYQAHYYTSYLPCPFAIPITHEDKDMSAILLTALAAEGFKQVLPAYYQTAIKTKYSTDEQSGEMLDLMLKNIRADGIMIYADDSSLYNLNQFLTSGQGFASYWKSKEKTMKKLMEKNMNSIAALSGEVAP